MTLFCVDCGTEISQADVDEQVSNEGKFTGYCGVCYNDEGSTLNSQTASI